MNLHFHLLFLVKKSILLLSIALTMTIIHFCFIMWHYFIETIQFVMYNIYIYIQKYYKRTLIMDSRDHHKH